MDSLTFNNSEMEAKKGFKVSGLPSLSISMNKNAMPQEFIPSKNIAAVPEAQYLQKSENNYTINELLDIFYQRQPYAADTVPASAEMNDSLYPPRMNATEAAYHQMYNNTFYPTGEDTTDSLLSRDTWPDAASIGQAEQKNAFNFLIKSVTEANKYLSLLTTDQLTVLRCIRPSLINDILSDIGRIRRERRTNLPNECAFCKNNGENEVRYTSHALKDGRGRVLCPVLRAFCCPRCGATGDRAHTIKYCPETDRVGLSSRRHPLNSTTFLMGSSSVPNTPMTTPTTNHSDASLWASFQNASGSNTASTNSTNMFE